MARMHSRKKGKSGSRKVKGKKKWVDITPKEVRKLVVKLRKAGNSAAKIGVILRDQYGVPDVKSICGVSLTRIIEEELGKQEYPDDLMDLIRKAVNLRKHLEKHKRDVHNRIRLRNIESKIRRIGKYYVRVGKLPSDWTYDPSKAALLVK